MGKKQLRWLRSTVKQAKANGDRIFIFSHLPFLDSAADAQNIAFDYDEVLDILHRDGEGQVVAVFAGHCHRGGYARDDYGIHHITMQSPLTHGECFGYVDVYESQLVLSGVGKQRSYSLEI